jgi:hypothetical protein
MAEPIKGIRLYVHYGDYMGPADIRYDWNLYVTDTRLARFGNHYIGVTLSLKSSQLQAQKAFLAMFTRILLDNFEHAPESIGWTGTEWKEIP